MHQLHQLRTADSAKCMGLNTRTWRGLRNDEDSPIASSMYFLSSGEMVGWAAGLSYDTRIQNKYQNIPKLPGRGRERKKDTDIEDKENI